MSWIRRLRRRLGAPSSGPAGTDGARPADEWPGRREDTRGPVDDDGPVVELPGEWDDRGALFGEEPEYEYADEEEGEWLTADEEEFDEDEFTQTGGSDFEREGADRDARWDEPGFEAGAYADAPGGWNDLPVVETLLSKKPRPGSVTAVVGTLVVLAFGSALYWWGPREIAESLPASGETVFGRGEVWRLFTAMAAHADAIHFLSNALFLTWLIYFSYGAFGPSLFPWATVPAAALSLAATLEGYPPNIRVVGASGLLYLLAGTWLTLYVLVERRLSIPKRLLRATGVFLIVLVPTSIEPQVSYRAHAMGLLFGIGLALAYYLARRDTIRAAERRAPPGY